MFSPRVNFLDIEDDWVCPCKLRQQGRVGKATYKAINGLWRYKFVVDSEFVPGVTGGRILPNEDLVLVNYNEQLLTIHSENGEVKRTLKLLGHPWDVALYGEELVVVSFNDIKKLHVINIHTLELSSEIEVPGTCYGVWCLGNTCFATSGQILHRIDIQTKTDRPMQMEGIGTCYVFVDNERIYYADYYSLHCVTHDGDEVFNYKHPNLTWPRGVAVDTKGYIYVAGYKSNNIHKLTMDGRLFKILLTQDEGINHPSCLHFECHQRKLLISIEEGRAILEFKV